MHKKGNPGIQRSRRHSPLYVQSRLPHIDSQDSLSTAVDMSAAALSASGQASEAPMQQLQASAPEALRGRSGLPAATPFFLPSESSCSDQTAGPDLVGYWASNAGVKRQLRPIFSPRAVVLCEPEVGQAKQVSLTERQAMFALIYVCCIYFIIYFSYAYIQIRNGSLKVQSLDFFLVKAAFEGLGILH
jgi:hypothetical protein